MSLFPKVSDLIANNPLHRAIGDLQNGIKVARGDIQSLACSLKTNPPSNCAVASPPKTESKIIQPKLTPNPSFEVPTEEETVVELKSRLAEEIVGAESDLSHKLKINGKACTCLERKHNLQIKSLSRELMPKDPQNPLYQRVIDWFNTNEPKMTAKASASGQYDEEYLKLSGQLGNFRRQLTGTGQGLPFQPVKDFFLKEKENT